MYLKHSYNLKYGANMITRGATHWSLVDRNVNAIVEYITLCCITQ